MKILHLDENHEYLSLELEKLGFENQYDYKSSRNQILNKIGNYHGIIIRSRMTIDKEIINTAKKLKFIARVGSGLENIDLVSAKKNKVKVISAGEANSNAVGEHALGMLLNLLNNISISNSEIMNGIWERGKNRGIELEGKVIGIIGYGKTGKSFAKKLSGFDCKVIFNDIKKLKSNQFAQYVSLDELKMKSDIISIHTDLNKTSLNLINIDFINSCKKNFILINTSRGKCVNSNDLVTGLKNKKITGCCLDVLDFEDMSFENIKKNKDFDCLKNSNNIILTPHIAGWTIESKLKLSKVIIEKIKEL